jgi:hypothetical protein
VTIRQRQRLRLSARIAIAAVVVGGLCVVLAPARAARIEAPSGSRTPAFAAAAFEPDADRAVVDPTWSLETIRIERLGFRQGRRHAIEVVPLGPSSVEVEVGTAEAFLAMRTAAGEAGVDLRLESGFRTLQQQQVLYRAWRGGYGNKAAVPGRSNHQSGRALDIAVSDAGVYEWLKTNAASYGFMRTVRGEPWHWEYVKAPVAGAAIKRVAHKRVAKAHGKRAKAGKAGKAGKKASGVARRRGRTGR